VLIAVLTAVSLAFSLATWWGPRGERGLLDWLAWLYLQRMGKAESTTPTDLHAPCEVQAVLSGKERLVLPLPGAATDLEIDPRVVSPRALGGACARIQ